MVKDQDLKKEKGLTPFTDKPSNATEQWFAYGLQDPQLSTGIEVRWIRNRWVVTSQPQALQNGDYYIDEATRRVIFYNSQTNDIYWNAIVCNASGAISVPDSTQTIVLLSNYTTNDPWLQANAWFITITESAYYYLHWYVLCDTWTWYREVSIYNGVTQLAFNRIPWVPAQSVPVTGWWGGTVNIPAASMQNPASVDRLAYLNEWDILSLRAEQDSWWPLNCAAYLLLFKI